jgi:spectinomycin phosphotransferase
LKLAPRERDLSTLVQAGYGDQLGADAAMVELFDLEWRLLEIDAYAAWFAAPHTGTTDDRVAHEALRSELDRGPWWRS